MDKVVLAGHSQGTVHGGNYMSAPARAAKVADYINFSGTPSVPVDIPRILTYFL
jgi:hypothetical protein